ncbi:hypothetical protein H0H87_001813 [Tephrocybe sp. NHM501043]|nr:hypothetical protein H0H87_001813 [Tephrocybe sp. NHM501043]
MAMLDELWSPSAAGTHASFLQGSRDMALTQLLAQMASCERKSLQILNRLRCERVPINSVPTGSSHRIRIWTKSLVNQSAAEHPALPFQDSYIFQRIYKNDMFKLGAQLDFENMSNKATMAFPVGAVQIITTSASSPPQPTSATRNGYPDEKAQKGYQ